MAVARAGLVFAVVAMGFWLAFVQATRHAAVNAYARHLTILIIPVAIAIGWRIALGLGWWTILLFLVTSIVVGALNGIFARKAGREALRQTQPLTGTIALIALAASWATLLI